MTEEVQAPEVIEDAPAEPTPQPEPEQPAWDAETEEEARLLGWKSKDEWKGDVPPGYIDTPTDFMARLERSKPFRVMKERAEQATTAAEERLKRIEAAMDAGRRREAERMQAEYERKIAEISQAQRRAVEEADPERFDSLEKQRRELRAPQPEPQGDPLEPFYATHEWIKDPLLRSEGSAVLDMAMRTGALPPSADVATQVQYAEAQMKRKYPHMFQQEQKEAPKAPTIQKVDGGGLGIGTKKTGFESLPADAQAAFKRQVAQGIFEDNKEDRKFYYDEYSKFQ